jgi:hypothetical protein
MTTRTTILAFAAIAIATTSASADGFGGGDTGIVAPNYGTNTSLPPNNDQGPVFTPTAPSGPVVEDCNNVNPRLGCAVHVDQTQSYPSTYPTTENCNCEAPAPAPVYVPPQQTAQPCECEAPQQQVRYIEVPKPVYVPVRVPVRVAVPVPVRVEVPVAVRVPVAVPYEVRVPVRVEVPVAVPMQHDCGCQTTSYQTSSYPTYPTTYPTWPRRVSWPHMGWPRMGGWPHTTSWPHRVIY